MSLISGLALQQAAKLLLVNVHNNSQGYLWAVVSLLQHAAAAPAVIMATSRPSNICLRLWLSCGRLLHGPAAGRLCLGCRPAWCTQWLTDLSQALQQQLMPWLHC